MFSSFNRVEKSLDGLVSIFKNQLDSGSQGIESLFEIYKKTPKLFDRVDPSNFNFMFDLTQRAKRYSEVSYGDGSYNICLSNNSIGLLDYYCLGLLSFDLSDSKVSIKQIQGAMTQMNFKDSNRARDILSMLNWDKLLVEYLFAILDYVRFEGDVEIISARNNSWVNLTYDVFRLNLGKFKEITFENFLSMSNNDVLEHFELGLRNSKLSNGDLHLLPQRAIERYDNVAKFFGLSLDSSYNYSSKFKSVKRTQFPF